MISLELAKKLKNAGLRWEPKNGDFFTTPGTNLIQCAITPIRNIEYATSKVVWLPRLDQLLAEIEKRGYVYDLHFSVLSGIRCYWCVLKQDDCCWYAKSADTPEDAAGQALLWILEQETG